MDTFMYVPISSTGTEYTFSLGAYKAESEAEEAYLKFLTANDKFPKWFDNIKKEFKKEFNKPLSRKKFENLLFDLDYTYFWQDHNIFFTIEIYNAGDLIQFYEWDGWVNRPDDRNLYELVKNVLNGKFYEDDIKLRAEKYPII